MTLLLWSQVNIGKILLCKIDDGYENLSIVLKPYFSEGLNPLEIRHIDYKSPKSYII